MHWIVRIIVISGILGLCACTDGYEERGLCSYLGTCSMGLASDIDVDYSKELGSYDDGKDPTEYSVSGKATAILGGSTKTDEKSSDKSSTGGNDHGGAHIDNSGGGDGS